MKSFEKHLINKLATIREALSQLNELASDAILFVVDENSRLLGSLTDGDVRRGLIKGLSIESNIMYFIQSNPKFIIKETYSLSDVYNLRNRNFRIIPIVDKNHKVLNILNFRTQKSYLPINAVIMAGGRGERLKPLTDTIPKPLLKVGDKPIIEHNIDRLTKYGVDDFWISVRYLGKQIEKQFGNGMKKNITINYIYEDSPLGTIGAVSKIDNFNHDIILITNSDILTNIDYEDFLLRFINSGADIGVATIPYEVNIPYAVLETRDNKVLAFKEKPKYTYYSNGGIYLLKKSVLQLIPKNSFFNATELMEQLLANKGEIYSYPLNSYWLDIGRHEDYEKAQADFQRIKF